MVLDREEHALDSLEIFIGDASQHLAVHLLCNGDHAADHVPALVSDVDALGAAILRIGTSLDMATALQAVDQPADGDLANLEKSGQVDLQIGRASCRERVCQYV